MDFRTGSRSKNVKMKLTDIYVPCLALETVVAGCEKGDEGDFRLLMYSLSPPPNTPTHSHTEESPKKTPFLTHGEDEMAI